MSNEITTFLAPKNAKEAFEIAANLAQSNMIPAALKGKAADIVVCMAYGAELGLQPLQSLQNIAVINGRPSLWGDAMRALVLNSHDLVSLKEWNEDDVFYCEIKRKTKSGGEITITKSFGDKDAKKAGLLGKKGPWDQYPDRMKQLRAFGFSARDAYADRLRGFITREEAMDYQDVKDVTPAKELKELKETGNKAIDSIICDSVEITQEESSKVEVDLFSTLLESINTSSTVEEFASASELVSNHSSNINEEQLSDLRDAAKTKKKQIL